MSVEMMREAVAIVGGRAKLEASGNITLENVAEVARTESLHFGWRVDIRQKFSMSVWNGCREGKGSTS
jgi:nicotinate-nucleotide pyrophosphorylase